MDAELLQLHAPACATGVVLSCTTPVACQRPGSCISVRPGVYRRSRAGNHIRLTCGRLGGHGRRANGAAAAATPAATKGDGWTGADDRVASCDDDPSCGRGYVRRRDGMPLARRARRNIVVVGRRAGFDIHVGPWDVRGVDHVLRHGDLGHVAGADGIGMENKRPAESLPGSAAPVAAPD